LFELWFDASIPLHFLIFGLTASSFAKFYVLQDTGMNFTGIEATEMETRGAQGKSARRGRDLVEFLVAYGLISLALWTPQPWQRWLSLAALGWVIVATCLSFDGWKAMGFRVVGFWRSAWLVAAALVLAAGAIAVAAWLETLHAPNSPGLFVERYWAYTIWAFLQEFLLLNFFLLRLLRLIPNRIVAALAAATLFALTHLPNPVLAPLTMLWGCAACLAFLRYRNIYMPALGHAIFGICVAITVPGPVDHNMRVGLGYLTYGHHRHGNHANGTRSTIPYPR
jgi:hypothetical protein